jgi:hypothetical protein
MRLEDAETAQPVLKRTVADFLESNLVFAKVPLAAQQLDLVFELIAETGGIEGFMREVSGLNDPDIAAIRSDLLD